jgi:DNA-binding transcriptional ArsR family regulator
LTHTKAAAKIAPVEHMLSAIAEPHRREILNLLTNTELSSGEIATRFDVTHSAISQHLKILMDAGLVSVRKEGTRHLYRACPEGLDELRSLLLYLVTCFCEDELTKLNPENVVSAK